MIERIHELIDDVKAEQTNHAPPQAAREFALAITSLEDAAMRIVRGQVMKLGRYPTAADAESTIHPDQLTFLDDEKDLVSAA
jgi:hypothetical protein